MDLGKAVRTRERNQTVLHIEMVIKAERSCGGREYK